MFLSNKVIFAVWMIIGIILSLFAVFSYPGKVGVRTFAIRYLTAMFWWSLCIVDELLLF